MKEELFILQESRPELRKIFEKIRETILKSATDEEGFLFLVTSMLPNQGKSFVTANLAVDFALSGKKTLLVDGDLRRGRIHHVFDVPQTPGYSELLSSDIWYSLSGSINEERCNIKSTVADDGSIIQKVLVEQTDCLSVLTCGSASIQQGQLDSKRNRELLHSFQKRYEVILIDCPPVSVVDALSMINIAKNVLLVVSDHEQSSTLIHKVEQGHGKICGLVVNKVRGRNVVPDGEK